MNDLISQVFGSAQSAFFYGTALYAVCHAGDFLRSKMADSRSANTC